MTHKFFIHLALSLLLLHGNNASAQALAAPTTISNIYSDIDMRMRLATKANAKDCTGELCTLNTAFDAQVQQLGERLAATAYKVYPDLSTSVRKFTFIVADKKEPSMASNDAGKIVVFRGIQSLALNEEAVSFILAREMGHVIGLHHHKNTSTKLILSVLASVLFPAMSLFSASNVAAQASTTAATSVASAATSYLGSEAVLFKIKPSQLIEADNIAINLLTAQGWDMRSVVRILQFEEAADSNGWLKDLHITTQHLNDLISTEDASTPKTEAAAIWQEVGTPAQ
ncbi:MAG: hypothetical protein EXR38_06110 [Methylotenera sp.]|nr:hypothetical protein [Methylotenera sp.]MSQ00051.1 hypothetical protein [Methylotenera sp.]